MRNKNYQTEKQIRLGKSNVHRKIYSEKKSQMIVLMGVVLSISIFVISSLAADIANLDIVVPSERFISLVPEFTNVKNAFGKALNYNLASNITLKNNQMLFIGNITDIYEAFSQTKNEFYKLELQHDIIFDAKLNNYWYKRPLSSDNIYQVNITLSLDDRNTRIVEDVLYSIVCKPYNK